MTEEQPLIELPYKLDFRDYQPDVWDYMMQDKPGLRALTVWPRRNGKDLIALNVLVAKALQRRGLYLYLAPFQSQVRLIIWLGDTNTGERYLDYIPPEALHSESLTHLEITLVNGSILKFTGSDKFNNKMGAGAKGAVFTDYSLHKPEPWNYIRPMLRENGGWAMFNGTSRGPANHMYQMAMMAEKNDRWFYQYLTCEDTGFPSQEEIQLEREDGMPEHLIQQEYYNSWDASDASVFIPADFVMPCFKADAEILPNEYQFEPTIFGVDVAYSPRGDKAVIFCRQGRKVHFVRWFIGMDNQAFADEIARLEKIFKPIGICIDAGRGEGVISRLDRMNLSHLVHGIHFSTPVYNGGYANIKAKMWGLMLEWFQNPNKPDLSHLDPGECLHANEPVSSELMKELTLPYRILDDRNRIAVEGKKSLKTRGEDSPDLAEAGGLSFAVDFSADFEPTNEQREAGITRDDLMAMQEEEEKYDPLTFMENIRHSD